MEKTMEEQEIEASNLGWDDGRGDYAYDNPYDKETQETLWFAYDQAFWQGRAKSYSE